MQKKAYAKVNIFLKIVGTRGDYHELISRFYRIDSLYDIVSFVQTDAGRFEILGCDHITRENNTLYKAFCALNHATNNPEIIQFFETHSVRIEKNIPEQAGLGGGSSDAAAFMLLCNDVLDLRLSKQRLIEIAMEVGADVAFFVTEYKSANVSGIGEVIEPFEDCELDLQLLTPKIACSTPQIYKQFRKNHLDTIDITAANSFKNLDSLTLLQNYTPEELNDLFAPALKLHPQLSEHRAPRHFFSGSGSTLFSLA